MKKIFLVFLLTLTTLFAKVDYSEMSNQELLALMGYVAPKNQASFQQELKSRKPTFTQQEKFKYQKNLQIIRKMKKK